MFSRLMGDNLSETIRKIMQKLFTDNFFTQYSYIGFKGKRQLFTLQSCVAIIGKLLFTTFINRSNLLNLIVLTKGLI